TTTGDIVFSLYDVASGGTPLATDTHVVAVQDGLFTTALDFDSQYYDGRGLWLEISIRGEVLIPRQEFRPVPYALGLVPGATVEGALVNPLVTFINNDGTAVQALSTGDRGHGIVASNDGIDGVGLHAIKTQDGGAAIIAETMGISSPGVYAITSNIDSEGVYAVTSGENSEGVYAETHGNGSPGVSASTDGDNSDGMRTTTDGWDSNGITAITLGDYSEGVYAYTEGAKSPALYGESTRDVGVYGIGKDGGYFTTNQAGTSWPGSAGVNVSTKNALNPGIVIRTTGANSEGIFIQTSGKGSEAIAAYANAEDTTGILVGTQGTGNTGIYVFTVWSDSVGVYTFTERDRSDGARTITLGANSPGMNASTRGANSPGVTARSEQARGVEGFTESMNEWVPAIFGQNEGAGDGVYGVSQNRYGTVGISETNYTVYGDTKRTDHKYGVYTPDYMYAAKYDGGGADIAEYAAVRGIPEPGTVLVIGDDGILEPSTTACDTAVAGIVSTAPGVSLGTKEEGNDGEALVALAGRVPCKVDASYGAVKPGDLLTTSPTPGHAMKADNPQIGTVLGKAMGSLDEGTGVLDVIVTLQ
ncbi:MAG: hypothetical protein APR53_09420, partial [Methanoculleus sp. SDB]